MRDLTGQTFGSYRLEEPIGRGGMGEVYRARHLRLTNRDAAVKVLPAYLASEPDFLRRFEQEANSAAAFDHPNILPIWDYGEQDGVPYLAMPLVTGGTLKELLEQEGPLPLERAGEYLRQIGEALDYAHSRGIIHRDVKPANIFLRGDGRPLLGDFGIAKVLEEGQGQGLTRAGTGVGTPEFMAPEQIEGKAEARSDLYALGVVLYQMLTGKVPYSGSTPYEVAYKQMYTPLPPIREVAPNLSPEIERVLNKALAKTPDGRYGTARELSAAFGQAVSDADAPHFQTTGPLIMGPGDTAIAPTTPAPPVYQPYQATSPAYAAQQHAPAPYYGYAGTPPPPAHPPHERDRRNSRWPLVLAGLLGAFLVLCIAGIAAFAAFRNGGDPTPTRAAVVNVSGTQTAVAIQTASAGAAGALATQTAVAQNANATATAVQQGELATATAQAEAGATATAQAQNEVATATAAAQRNALATQTAVAQVTATAQAQPTVTPTRPPAMTPTPAAGGTGAWGPALPTLSGGKAYRDPEGRFSFSVPQQWTQAGNTTAEAQFDAPNNQATMNVTLEKVSPNTTIDQYNTAAERQLKQQLPDYQQIALDKVTVNGQHAYRRVYKATVQGTLIQIQQVYFVKDGTAHVLTFAALPENFDKLSQTFNEIAGTYKSSV